MPEQYIHLLKRYRAFVISLVVSVACWTAYYAWYLAGFPGHSIHVFCEVDSGGLFRQNANTISSFAFVYFGHVIAWRVGRQQAEGHPPPPDNLMNRTDFYSGVYAHAVILLGWGTVAMHGSLTSLGGFLDVSAMYIWISFCVCYSFIRAIRRGAFVFVLIYGLLSAALIYTLMSPADLTFRGLMTAVLSLGGRLPLSGDELNFGSLILAAVLLEGICRWMNRKRVRFEDKWVLYTFVSFASGLGIWNLSLEGRPFYYPDTIFQGHAVWHILCAVATWTIYRYYRSETPLVLS